jgi:HrpA-like RNA helicase
MSELNIDPKLGKMILNDSESKPVNIHLVTLAAMLSVPVRLIGQRADNVSMFLSNTKTRIPSREDLQPQRAITSHY